MEASDHRGLSQRTPVPTIFPKKEQAIIIDVNEELRLNDYVSTVGNIVGPKNIFAASRISNNRVCIYLTDIKLVDMITEKFPTVKIDQFDLNLRRLVSPAKRIILSNVPCHIPHNVLEPIVANFGFKLASKMSFLRAGRLDDEYSHVVSFRRQVYIHPNESINLPSSVLIKFEETNYRIFLSFDQLICFSCKLPGHIADQCPQQNKNMNDTSDVESTYSDHSEPENIANKHSHQTFAMITQEQTSLKRNAPSSTSQSTQEHLPQISELQDEDNININQPESIRSKIPETNKTKRLKKSDSVESLTPLDEQLSPVKNMLEKNPKHYILNFEQLTDFLENVHGSPDALSISKNYTNDTDELLNMLEGIYPLLNHRSIKNRITRLGKRIKQQLEKVSKNNVADNNEPNSHSSKTQ